MVTMNAFDGEAGYRVEASNPAEAVVNHLTDPDLVPRISRWLEKSSWSRISLQGAGKVFDVLVSVQGEDDELVIEALDTTGAPPVDVYEKPRANGKRVWVGVERPASFESLELVTGENLTSLRAALNVALFPGPVYHDERGAYVRMPLMR